MSAPSEHSMFYRHAEVFKDMKDNFCWHSSVAHEEAAMRAFLKCYHGYTVQTSEGTICLSAHMPLPEIFSDVTISSLPATPDTAATTAMRAVGAGQLEAMIVRVATALQIRFQETLGVLRRRHDNRATSTAFKAFCQLWQGFTLTAARGIQMVPAEPSDAFHAFLGKTLDKIAIAPPAKTDSADVVKLRTGAYESLRR